MTVRLTARSSDYRTPPWGFKYQPPFINLCIAVETTLAPRDLLAHAQSVELQLGRDRAHEKRWGPRTADIDIIAYGDLAVARTGPDRAASAAVRARLRAAAACRNRARPDRSAGAACARRRPASIPAASSGCRRGHDGHAICFTSMAAPRRLWQFAPMTDELPLAAEFPRHQRGRMAQAGRGRAERRLVRQAAGEPDL